jgi:SAM-dependent methyltransferase
MRARYYADLLVNRSRVEAFRRGIGEAVRPGDRVLDLGTGLGTYAFFAARAGAGVVWAVDASPVVHLAETLAAANGLGESVRFVRGRVPGVELPRGLDVLVYEDFPVALFDRDTWEILRGVQEGHLAPGARMVPAAARLNLAPVESPRIRGSVFPLDAGDDESFGLSWAELRSVLADTPRKEQLAPEELRGRAVQGPRLALLPVPPAGALRVGGRWTADRDGTVHALALWFDLEVHEGGWISNEPRAEPEPWGQWILPVDPALQVAAGQTLEAEAGFEELDGGAPGWLSWRVAVGGDMRSGHEFGGVLFGEPDLRDAPEV